MPSITARVTLCLTEDNTYNITLSATPPVGADHVATIDFRGKDLQYAGLIGWRYGGNPITGAAFLFTSAGESYTIKATITNIGALLLIGGNIQLELPYVVSALYAPSWASIDSVIPVNIDTTQCPEGLIIRGDPCSTFSDATEQVIFQEDFPSNLSCTLAYTVLGVPTTKTATFTIGQRACFSHETDVDYIRTSRGNGCASFTSVPLNAVLQTVTCSSYPGGSRVWNVSGAPTTVAWFRYTGTSPNSNCAPAYLCSVSETKKVPIAPYPNYLHSSHAFVRNGSPPPGTAPCYWIESTSELLSENINFTWTPLVNPTHQWTQREFTINISVSLGNSFGSGAINLTVTKVACQNTLDIVGSLSLSRSASGYITTTHPPSASWQEEDDSTPRQFNIPGTSCYLAVNPNFTGEYSYGGDGTIFHCTAATPDEYGVKARVAMNPYIRFNGAP